MAKFRASKGFVGFTVLVVALAVVAAAVVAKVGSSSSTATPRVTAPSQPPRGQAPATGAGDGHMAAVPIPPPSDLEKLPIKTTATERVEPEVRDGVKVFRLAPEPVRWELVKGKWVTAWAFNAQVPGPQIWVNEGDRVRIELANKLPEPTTIHWHGIQVPNEMDGVPGVTQDAVEPGKTFTYEFEAKPSGTFWYHSHFDSNRQLDMGLYGAFVIKGKDEPSYDKEFIQIMDEWIRLQDGRNGWEGVDHAGHNPGEYNWFTMNGKSAPDIPHMVVKQGDRVRLRMINAGYQTHPMHLHGKRMTVVAKDGAPLASPYQADTILIGTGERYDVEFVADDPGSWMFHCHIDGHLTNDATQSGGLMTFVDYEGYKNAYQKSKGA